MLTLRTILLSLQALMSAAEPDDPQDAVVAKQYKGNRVFISLAFFRHKMNSKFLIEVFNVLLKDNHAMFEMTAKHWTNVYAGGPNRNADCDQKVQCLMDMGIKELEARMVLSKVNWNVEKAIDDIFS